MDQPSDNKERVAQLAGGWNRLARDLDRAIRAARLEPAEAILFGEARELSWPNRKGAEAQPFRLNFSAIARLHKLDRSWLSRTFARMVACRFFVESGKSFLIGKDYRLWTWPDGSPRLSKEQVKWCLEARRTVADTPQSGVADTPHPPVADTPQGVLSIHHTPCSGYTTPPVADTPHPRPESLEVALKGTGAPAPGICLEREERVLESVCRPDTRTQTPDDSPHLIPSEDRQLIEAAGKLAESWFPMRDMGIQISRHDQHFNPKSDGHFPAAWLRPALEKLRDVPADKHTWPYLKAILRGFARAGGPPAGSPAAPKARPNPHEARRAERRALIERLKAQLPSDAEAADGAR